MCRTKQQSFHIFVYEDVMHCNHNAVMFCVCVFVVRELAELHKTNASRASVAEEAALSRETQAKEQLSVALERAQEEARIQQEALANQVTQTNVLTHVI